MTVLWVLVGAAITWIAYWYLVHEDAPAEGPAGDLDGPAEYEVEVVGESHYQPALEHLCGGRSRDSAEKYCKAVLVLEDSNRHDPQAVRVDIDGRTVGYLPRHTAPISIADGSSRRVSRV